MSRSKAWGNWLRTLASEKAICGGKGGIELKSVGLFVTWMVDAFRPEAGVAVVLVLERRGAEVRFPPDQTFCGQFTMAAHDPDNAAMGLTEDFVMSHWPDGGNVVAYTQRAEGLSQMAGATLPPLFKMVTGPSMTADIEGPLVIGGHGPVRVGAIVYEV